MIEFETLEKESPWKSFFKWKKTDAYIVLATTCSTMLVWILLLFKKNFSHITSFYPSLPIMYISKSMYNTPPSSITNAHLHSNHINMYPPGAPIVFAIIRLCCFGFWTPALIIYDLVFPAFTALIFERFLTIWNIVSQPVLTACLLAVFPMRYLTFHTTLAPDCFYFSCCFMAFIGYKLKSMDVIFWSGFVASLFDRQGIVIALGFFISFFKMSQYGKAFKMIFGFLCATLITSTLQAFCGQGFFSYLSSAYFKADDMTGVPFKLFFKSASSISEIGPFHTLWTLFGFSVLGTVLLSRYSFVFVGFLAASLVFISCLDFKDIYRYSVCLEIFAILVGFDGFINSAKFKKALPIFLIIYSLFSLTLCIGNITYDSARNASDIFSKF